MYVYYFFENTYIFGCSLQAKPTAQIAHLFFLTQNPRVNKQKNYFCRFLIK